MTKLLAVFCLLPLAAHSWLEHRPPFLSTYHRQVSRTILFSEQGASTEENPCWQDLYDEDCSMDKTYAASFVASEWLKKMPCAQGIAVRENEYDIAVKCPHNAFFLTWSTMTSAAGL